MPSATHQNSEPSIKAAGSLFNPELEVLHLLTFETFKFDSKTDNQENFSVTMQTKTLKTCPDPRLPPVARSDAHAEEAAIE